MATRRRRLVLVAVFLLVLAGAPALAQPVMILPGRAIGPFEIGMPLDRARSIMESFGRVEEISSAGLHGFCNPEQGVGVCAFDQMPRLSLNTPGTVAYLVTDDARFTTDVGGHKVGALLLEFLRTFGLYTGGQGSEVRWDGRGLAVDVSPGERGITVRLIGVFSPRSVSAMAMTR